VSMDEGVKRLLPNRAMPDARWAPLIVVAFSACTTSSPKPANGDTTSAAVQWVVRPDGVGPVNVGMTSADVRRALDLPASAGSVNGCSYLPGTSATALHANVMLTSDTVVRFDVRDGSIATAEGARVGDSEARVQSLYSGRVSMQPHKYVAGGHYLVVTDPAHPADRIVFETDGKVVTQFRAGRTPEVTNVEGCG
jgi:hypothetical protein